MSVEGIGPVTPVALHIINATATLYLQQGSEARESLADPTRPADFWRMRIGALGHEAFEAAHLDSGLRLARDGVETLEEGTIERAAVYPRMCRPCAGPPMSVDRRAPNQVPCADPAPPVRCKAFQAAPGRWPGPSPGDETSTGRFVSRLGPLGGQRAPASVGAYFNAASTSSSIFFASPNSIRLLSL